MGKNYILAYLNTKSRAHNKFVECVYNIHLFFVFRMNFLLISPSKKMVVVAQLVRASDCDSEGRGFEPHHPPKLVPLKSGIFFARKKQLLQIAYLSNYL